MGTRFSKLKSHRGKFPKAHQATGKYYKMVDPCFEESMQELNRKLGNICLSPRPPDRLCLTRQFQSAVVSWKYYKHQILKGADPERVIKNSYDKARDYMDIWDKRIQIQQRAISLPNQGHDPYAMPRFTCHGLCGSREQYVIC